MDLIIYQMVELEVMHESNRYLSIKEFSAPPITKLNLTVFLDRHSCPFLAVFLIFKEVLHNLRIKNVLVFFFKLIQRRIDIIVGELECIHNINLVGPVKYRRRHIKAQRLGSKAQMNLQHLSNVHSGRHTQRIQHDIQRTSIWQKWHILYRKYAGNHTFVSVTSCHFISYLDLSLLCNIDTNGLIDAR